MRSSSTQDLVHRFIITTLTTQPVSPTNRNNATMSNYAKVPSTVKVELTPYTVNIPDDKLKPMLDLVRLSPIGPPSYENEDESRTWGMNRKWLNAAKQEWVSGFDWRRWEKRINSYPNYMLDVKDDDGKMYEMHFLALFSEKRDAVPIGFYHVSHSAELALDAFRNSDGRDGPARSWSSSTCWTSSRANTLPASSHTTS